MTISAEALKELVIRDPVTALEQHLFELSPEQLNHCISSHNGIALREATLTPIQIHKIAGSFPGMSLRWIADKLTFQDFDRCLSQATWAGIEHAGHLLTSDQIKYCLQQNPEAMVIHLPHKMPPSPLLAFIHNHPEKTQLALRHVKATALARRLLELNQAGESIPAAIRRQTLKILANVI